MFLSFVFWVFWFCLLILVFWAVGAYHRLSRLRSSLLQTFARLDAHLVQLLAWLGEYLAASAGTHTALPAAAEQCAQALACARARPLHTSSAVALRDALQLLEAAWLAEMHPSDQTRTLPASAAPADTAPWLQRWEQYQAHNAQAQQDWRLAAVQYNTAIAQFPAQLLASLLGFKSAHTS